MSGNLVLIEQHHSGIFSLTLNRPEKRNALNIPLLKSLLSELVRLHHEKECRVVILRGAGPVFCSGLDLKEASAVGSEKESSELIAAVLQHLYQMPQVTLAALHGAALAGGAGLACACDLLIMESSAVIGFPEVLRGLVAAQVMVFLKKKLTDSRIKELTLLGESITAEKAYEIGLASYLTVPGQLLPACIDIGKKALKGSPEAIEATKQLITDLSLPSLTESFAKAIHSHHTARKSAHALEGLKAFLDKRKPFWDIS